MPKKYNLVTYFYFGIASILCTFYYPFLTQGIGLTLEEVSKVVSFGAVFALLSQPYLGYLFTKMKDKKVFMMAYLGLLAIINISFLFVSSSWIYLFAIIYGCIALPLIGTYEIYLEKIAVYKGFEYSEARKWGSIGMGSITLIGGSILTQWGFKGLHILGLVFLTFCAVIIHKEFDEVEGAGERKKVQYKEVFANKHVLIIFLMTFLGMGSYVGIDFAFSSYLTEFTGNVELSNQLFSISTGTKIILEFIVFIVIGKYIILENSKKVIISVFAFSSLRFLCISTGILPIVIAGDQLHSIVFPLFLTIIFKYLREFVRDELIASCYSIISMLMFGISNLVYPPLFSALQNQYGYTLMYGANVLIGILTCIIGICFLPKSQKVAPH